MIHVQKCVQAATKLNKIYIKSCLPGQWKIVDLSMLGHAVLRTAILSFKLPLHHFCCKRVSHSLLRRFFSLLINLNPLLRILPLLGLRFKCLLSFWEAFQAYNSFNELLICQVKRYGGNFCTELALLSQIFRTPIHCRQA